MMCTLPSPIRPGNAEPTKTPMACSDSIFPKDQTLARSTKSTLLRLYKGSITDQESASIIKPHMKSYGKKHLGLLLFEFNEYCTQCKKKASVFQSVVFFKKEIEEILHGNGLRVFIFIMQADNIDKNDKKRKPRRVVKKKQHLILRKKGEECMNFQGFIFSNQI